MQQKKYDVEKNNVAIWLHHSVLKTWCHCSLTFASNVNVLDAKSCFTDASSAVMVLHVLILNWAEIKSWLVLGQLNWANKRPNICISIWQVWSRCFLTIFWQRCLLLSTFGFILRATPSSSSHFQHVCRFSGLWRSWLDVVSSMRVSLRACCNGDEKDMAPW